MHTKDEAVVLSLVELPQVTPGEHDGFAVRSAAELSPRHLAEVSPAIRGLVTSGKVPVSRVMLERFPELEIVASFGVGYELIDVAAARDLDVVVTNTPDILTDEVADLTVGLLLATVRKIPQADRYVREGRWERGAFPLTLSLRGRKVGIVGLGRIGTAVAQRLQAFGLNVSYHARHPHDADLAYFDCLSDLASAVDTLVICTPGGRGTHHLIDADVLAALGPDGVVINVSRGSVVDEEALCHVISDGVIAGAGLDVFADEPHVPGALLAHPNVVVLPHVGSATSATRDAMGRLVLDNLVSWFGGRGPLTPVPETPVTPGAGR